MADNHRKMSRVLFDEPSDLYLNDLRMALMKFKDFEKDIKSISDLNTNIEFYEPEPEPEPEEENDGENEENAEKTEENGDEAPEKEAENSEKEEESKGLIFRLKSHNI